MDKQDKIKKRGRGQPAKYQTPEELKKAIDIYIEDCPDFTTKHTSEGTSYKVHTPTIAGLAYFLGFATRQSMYDYEKAKEEYSYIIMRARLWIEKNYEQNLVFNGATGSIFALKNMGWRDKTEVDVTGDVPTAFTFIINGEKQK